MFGLFRSKKSPVRQRVERIQGVHRTWIEWTLKNGLREPILFVECEWELDPASPDFDADAIAQVAAAARQADAGEGPPPTMQVVPHNSRA